MKRRTRGLPPVPKRPIEFGGMPNPPKDAVGVGAFETQNARHRKGEMLHNRQRLPLYRHVWTDRSKYKPHIGAKQRAKWSKD